MKCSQCKQPVPEYGAVLLTCDGDFACSDACEYVWKKERDNFFNNIITDDKRFQSWMLGE